jgi:hypothetical protein
MAKSRLTYQLGEGIDQNGLYSSSRMR